MGDPVLLDLVTALAALASAFFFLAGTVGLLRFPDLYTRLHAVTKADTLGLGFMAVAVACQAPTGWLAAKSLLVWLVALGASAVGCGLVAAHALRTGRRPWGEGTE